MAFTIGTDLPVGSIIHSMLTTTQFANEMGDTWVLADGRNVAGSRYQTVQGSSTVPDLRGAFLRAKGSSYNPDGDLPIGTYTADKVKILAGAGGNPGDPQRIGYDLGYPGNDVTLYNNETSPRSITVNVFIKIN